MKKLRESANYNVIITVVLITLLVKVIKYACGTGIAVWRIVAWGMPAADIFYSTGTVIVALPFVVLAIAFVIQAVKRNPKLIIGAIVSLAVVAVTGVSLGAVTCMIACGYWLWMVTKLRDKPFAQYVKWFITIITILTIVLELVGGILSMGMGYLSEWEAESSLEAGDWSGWSTLDENGNMVRMEEDENGNITYYDEEGNGATIQEFEFD